MYRYWAVFVAGLVPCVLLGPCSAEEPVPTQLWLRAAVPPQPHGESPGVLLTRGDAVTPVDKIECEIGEVATVRFGPGERIPGPRSHMVAVYHGAAAAARRPGWMEPIKVPEVKELK